MRIFIITCVLSICIIACKSKKATTSSSNSPSEKQLEAIQSKYPGTTKAELEKGHSIFYGACTNCHKPKNVTGYEEQKLRSVIDVMAGKAKLSPAEKEAVLKYALAVNLAK